MFRKDIQRKRHPKFEKWCSQEQLNASDWQLWPGSYYNWATTHEYIQAVSTTPAIDIERVVDSQLSASSYTRKPNMLRHACAEFR